MDKPSTSKSIIFINDYYDSTIDDVVYDRLLMINRNQGPASRMNSNSRNNESYECIRPSQCSSDEENIYEEVNYGTSSSTIKSVQKFKGNLNLDKNQSSGKINDLTVDVLPENKPKSPIKSLPERFPNKFFKIQSKIIKIPPTIVERNQSSFEDNYEVLLKTSVEREESLDYEMLNENQISNERLAFDSSKKPTSFKITKRPNFLNVVSLINKGKNKLCQIITSKSNESSTSPLASSSNEFDGADCVEKSLTGSILSTVSLSFLQNTEQNINTNVTEKEVINENVSKNIMSDVGQQSRLGWLASSTTSTPTPPSAKLSEKEVNLIQPKRRRPPKFHLSLPPPTQQDRRYTIVSPHSPSKTLPGASSPSGSVLERWNFSTQSLRNRRRLSSNLPRIILPDHDNFR